MSLGLQPGSTGSVATGGYTAGGTESQAKTRELAIALTTYPRLCADDFNAQPDVDALRLRLVKAESAYAKRELLLSQWLKLHGQYVTDEISTKCAALILPEHSANLNK